jgi:hypothetical protein
MRTYKFHNALARHPEVTGRPVRVSELRDHFAPAHGNSCKSLLIKMGPFLGVPDAFQFDNNFPISFETGQRYAAFFESEVASVVQIATNRYLGALNSLSIPVPIPFAPDISLPRPIIDEVIDVLTPALTAALGEVIHLLNDGLYGRCGGMAFAAYDFYQDGRQAGAFPATKPPEGSELDQYILDRLIDSLELNAKKFLEWLMVLHVLPAIDELATATLLASAGNFAFPIGTAIGAFIGSQVDIFNLGGAGELLDMTSAELNILKARLDEEAAWPIGLIFAVKKSPFDQHQILAIGYENAANDRVTITVWDNRDPGGKERRMTLDMGGNELRESGIDGAVKGVFVEEYAPIRPPPNLK